jgi:cytochrome c oxidase subunit 2
MTFDPTFQLPNDMSTAAEHVDWTYYFIYWLSVVLFVAIVAAMIVFSYVYRKRKGHKPVPTGHNLPLEIAWTVAPIIILVLLFHWGFKGYMDLAVAPPNAMEIRVRAFQWGWDFEYPNGATDNKLHVPVGKPVKLLMSSNDVLHAFYAPELRTKRDLVPGMYTTVWFQTTKTGEVDLFCAEYCGGKSKDAQGNPLAVATGHWAMLSKVKVETQEEFDKYLDGIGDGGKPPEVVGEKIYKQKCASCHTVDGNKAVGPTWKGLFDKTESLADGSSVKVDDNYLRESILEPNAKVVTGFAPAMPTLKGTLKDKQIDAVIAYIKSLK